jgi:hypothetical protein
MALVTAAVLHNNNSRHRTILNPLAAKEAAVAASGASSNSAMAISVTLVSAATTTVTMDVAGAISGDAADSVRRTDHAAVEVEVVVAAAEEVKSRHLAHRSHQ